MNRNTLAVIAGVVVAAEAALLLFDTGPNVLLLAALVALVCATILLAASLGRMAARPEPAPPTPDRSTTHPGLRTITLRQALAGGDNGLRHAERVYGQLVAIVDDELVSVHGVERSADPEAARALLGPELAAFVSEPGAAASLTPRRLDHYLTLIEQV